ncbi:MAG TPA: GGDEF domain-containing protein [Candidatus Dormibacteraeota bacterium]|nr:GGDEF domain-containing protein [Candidatus Dormibacteraeota bacterium]
MLERSGVGAIATWGLERIGQSVSALAGAVVVVESGALHTAASHGLADPNAVAENPLLAAALKAAGPTVVHLPPDLPADRILAASSPTEVVAVPLRVDSVPIGAVLLVLDRPSTASERQFVSLQATTLALAIHSAAALEALELLAAQDPLTGLLNRRFGEIGLHEEYARAVRAQRSLGLLRLDLDRLKSVNDTYGHLAGDRMLKAVAVALGVGLREGDTVARFGGEEFLIQAPGPTSPTRLSWPNGCAGRSRRWRCMWGRRCCESRSALAWPPGPRRPPPVPWT